MKKDRFCVLCFRSTDKSKYFCDVHRASGITKKTNFRDRRAILRALRKEGIKIDTAPKNNYYSALSTHLQGLVAKHPTETEILNIQYTGKNEILLEQIIAIAKNYYPATYKKIRECADTTHYNINNMFTFICDKLDSQSRIPVININLDRPSDDWKRRWLEILARHEAYNLLIHSPTKRGPEPGTGQDKQLREKVSQLYQKFAADCIWGAQAKIAAELGLSNTRISKIVRELGLKQKHDKKSQNK